jgi:hypothetical protein
VPKQCKQANPVSFGTKSVLACTFYPVNSSLVLPLSPLFACFYNILELSLVLPYNHLLFLAKANKENNNNIDLSLSIRQNLKKYSSILEQRLVVKLFKQSYTLQRKRVLLLVFNKF